MPRELQLVLGVVSVAGLVACGSASLNDESAEWDGSEEVAAASQALAPSFTRVFSDVVSVSAGTVGTAQVYCPSGAMAVGGGLRGYSSYLRLEGSFPVANNRWAAFARNTSSSTQSFRVYVNCLVNPGSATVSYEESSWTWVGPGQTGSANAYCDNPSRLVGGGIAVGYIADLYPRYSKPGSNSFWTAGFKNEGTQNAFVMALAVCLTGIDFDWSEVSAYTALGAGSTGTAVTSCPAGSYATSSGFHIGRVSPFFGEEVSLYSSYPVDSLNWTVAARNNESSTVSLEAYSVCVDLN